jgi:hypothetical protein
MFYPRNDQISSYDELLDKTPAAGVTKGTPQQIQDVFGFWFTDAVTQNSVIQECAFIYKMNQVLADKVQGTGEAIVSGDDVYAIVAQAHAVSATPPAGGVAGVDYYWCGIAKEDAAGSATSVLINFDGTRYDEDI